MKNHRLCRWVPFYPAKFLPRIAETFFMIPSATLVQTVVCRTTCYSVMSTQASLVAATLVQTVVCRTTCYSVMSTQASLVAATLVQTVVCRTTCYSVMSTQASLIAATLVQTVVCKMDALQNAPLFFLNVFVRLYAAQFL